MTKPTHAIEPQGILDGLAAWATGMQALPEAAEREARLALVDTLACMLAGATEPQTAKALDAFRRERITGPSRSVVADLPLPCAAAALLNGTAAHALDFDDYEVPGSTHPSAALYGALLAIAEARLVTLDDVTRAYAAGYETICRLGEALGYGHYERGWHATATLGSIGAAAAGAHLAGLSRAATCSAMSIAASMSAGLKLQFGSDTKALHAGLAARAGVEAMALAEAGIDASANVMEGPHGFLALYGAVTSPGFSGVMPRIGQSLALVEYPILRKPWPSCAYTHRAIEAALKIATRPEFSAGRVAAGALRIPEPYLRVAGFTNPKNPNEARFSAIYCTAAALVDGAVTPATFATEALARQDVRGMMKLLRVSPYPLAPGLGDMSPAAPDVLTIHMADGLVLSETIAEVTGGPTRPLGEPEILEKFEACGGRRTDAEAILAMATGAQFRWSALRTVSAAAALGRA